ncbi:hypothetical protein AWB91_27235 [Mycobacterium paraense]|uniref:Uncharacterized protein n=1 Tax=Mycobacterium paraense TaxID=767916 RepID=A0ABX3VH20_9MYCO|nr:hypothetical protein [Mycobacterium paraense]ORW27548.1 hypothetical protein AWB91_27235 [Mycobacterium paraense]ORW39347.1 hypothetical protein AWB88_16230 [Mycobacterium paraense]
MTGTLDLTDARAKVERAKELHAELDAAMSAWINGGGVEAQSRRSHQFVCYKGFAKVNTAPPINLPLRAGEVLHALRTALDYTAFQIYLVGGGAPDGPLAHKVAFPIVSDPDKWDGVVAQKVPGAWPAAVAELRAVQQFKPPPTDPPFPLPPIPPLLSRLATLGGTDKHRNLSLFAAGAWSASMIAPEIEPWYSIQVRIYTPGPLLPLEPGRKVEVSRVSAGPAGPNHHPDDTYLWASGIQLKQPEPPELKFGFRANDETEINTRELPIVIDLVESIVQRFAALQGP